MADQRGGSQPVVPDDTNWPDWTYSLALRAVTGDTIDLRTLSRAQWFVFDPSSVDKPGGNDEVGDQAYNNQYYGATINHQAIGDFEAGVDQVNAVTGDLFNGIRGAMDLSTLAQLRDKVVELEGFLADTGGQLRKWARDLDSTAADFSGSAAHLIQVWLDKYAGLLELWSDRLKVDPTLLLSTAVQNARTDLDNFRVGMVNAWQNEANAGLRGRIQAAVDAETSAIRDYLVSQGLVAGTPAYTFDKSDPTKQPNLVVTPTMIQDFQDKTRAQILAVLAGYPKGDLRQAETWARINQSVMDTVSGSLDNLDAAARTYIKPLRGSYMTLSNGLKPLGALSPPGTGSPSSEQSAGGNGPGGPSSSGSKSDGPGPGGGPQGGGPFPDGTPPGGPSPARASADGPPPDGSAAVVPPPGGEPPAGGPAPDGSGPAPVDASVADAGAPADGSGGGPGAALPVVSGQNAPSPADGFAPVVGADPNGSPLGAAGSAAVGGGGTLAAPAAPLPGGPGTGAGRELSTFPPAGGGAGPGVADPAGSAGFTPFPLVAVGGGARPNRKDNKRRQPDPAAGSVVSPLAEGSAAPGAAPGASAEGHAGSNAAPTGGLVRASAVELAAGSAHGGHGLPADHLTAGGLGLPAGPRAAEFGLPSWDGRVGGDGVAGLAQAASALPAAGPQVGYRGSGFWPAGQYGPLPTQLAGSPVSRAGAGRMPYPPAMGSTRRLGPSTRWDRRGSRLTEDEQAWGLATTARAGVVGLVDDHPDDDELVVPGEAGRTRRRSEHEETAQVVIGRGGEDEPEDEFESEYRYDQGQP